MTTPKLSLAISQDWRYMGPNSPYPCRALSLRGKTATSQRNTNIQIGIDEDSADIVHFDMTDNLN